MLTLTQAQFETIKYAMLAAVEQVLEDEGFHNCESLAIKCSDNLKYFLNPDEVNIEQEGSEAPNFDDATRNDDYFKP